MSNKSNNPILNAVLSKLVSERDEALVIFDLIINKNMSDSGITGIVGEALSAAKKVTESEITIEWINNLVQDNNSSSKMADQIKGLQDTLNNNNNDNNGNNT
jgi:hypothetical protein